MPTNMILQLDQNLIVDNINESIKKWLNQNVNKYDQLINPPEYPETKILAKLAYLAYDRLIENRNLNESYLSEWKFIARACNTNNNYHGIAYFNPVKMHIVVAHKGTSVSWNDFLTDLEGIYLNKPTKQMSSACTFVSQIINAVKQIQSENKMLHFEIFITGHSLGGWLAQITSFSSKYLVVNTENGSFEKRCNSEGIHTHTVAFESPGCKEMLEELKDCYFKRYIDVKVLEYLDIITYLSAPNYVNMLNKHFGKVFRLIIDFQDLSWVQEKLMYNTIVHSMEKIVSFFENENDTIIKNVLDWPKGQKEYYSFFDKGEKLNNFHFEKCENQVRYCTKSINKKEIYKNVFSQNEINFLKCYGLLKPYKNDILEIVLNELSEYQISNQVIENVKRNLDFEITESNIIKCHSSDGTQKFVALMKKILFFYPEIINKFKKTSLDDNYKIYEQETNNYCKEINTFMKFDYEDLLKLTKIDSDITQIKTNNTNLCMAQLHSELESLKSITFIMLRLERLLLINSIISLKSLPLHKNEIKYIVIGCQDYDSNEYVVNSLKGVFDEPISNVHIIIVTNETVELECFKDIKIEILDLSFSQLNNKIQREILEVSFITLNNQDVSLKEVLGIVDTLNINKDLNEIITPFIISHILNNNKVVIETDFVKMQLCDYYIERKFIDDNRNEFSEEEMVEKSLNEKIIILSDKAGMGKSMVMAKVFQIMKKQWLIKINFNKYIKEFEEQKINFDQKEVIDLFMDLFFKNSDGNEFDTFRNELLKYNLQNNGNVVIFFDAYDEVSSQYKKVIDLLVGLKNTGIKCMWIAARTHCKDELVNKLEVKSSYSINPFSNKNQTDFLQKYWTLNLNIQNKEKLNKISKKVVSDIDTFLNGKELLSIPLLIYMLAEYYKNVCQDICNTNILTIEETNFKDKLIITDLYEHFVHEKINVYCNCLDKINGSKVKYISSCVRNEIIKSHQDMAVGKDLLNTGREDIGFIDSTIVNKAVFIPTTLLEFFIFSHIKSNIHKWEIIEQLFLDVFIDSSKQILRVFINDYLNEKVIQAIIKNHSEKIKNINNINKQIILLSTMEKTVNILKLIVASFENTDILKKLIMYKNIQGDTALHFAAENGRCDIIQILIDKGIDINTQNNRNETSLYRAAFNGEDDAVKILLKNNADIYISDNEGKTALHKAAFSGKLDVVNTLIQNNININTEDKMFKTALHEASINGHFEIIQVLINQDIQIDKRDIDGKTALHMAVTNGHTNIVKCLIATKQSNIVNIGDNEDRTALHEAVHKGNVKIVKILLNNNAATDLKDKQGETVVHIAAREGYKDVLAELIHHKVDVTINNKDDKNALQIAAFHNKCDIVELLVKHIDINIQDKYGETALHKAALQGNCKVLKCLLNVKAKLNIKNDYGKTALYEAARMGKTEAVKLLVDNNADTNIKQDKGTTALHIAAKKDQYEIVKILLTNPNTNINIKDNIGETALHKASYEGKDKIVEVLLKYNADIDIKDNEKKTPLHKAARSGHVAVVQILIENNAKVDIKDKWGKTALAEAEFSGQHNVIKLLRGNKSVYSDNTLLHTHVQENNISKLKELLETCTDVNELDREEKTALHVATIEENYNIVELLINHGLNINAQDKNGKTPLYYATKNKECQVLNILIKNGADNNIPNIKGKTPFHKAAYYGKYDMIDVLISNVKDINAQDEYGETALYKAIPKSYDIVKRIIENNADVNIYDTNKKTPLHVAAFYDKVNVVKLLIQYNGNVNAQDNDGKTPLHIAASKSHLKVIKTLIENNVDIEIVDKNNQTALHCAASTNNKRTVSILLKNNANINIRTAIGRTALHIATQKGNRDVVNLLLTKGADANIKDKDAKTILHTAAFRGHYEILEDLINHVDDINAINKHGETVLHCAAYKNIDKTVVLLQKKIDVFKKDARGKTALHVAALEGNDLTLSAMIDNIHDINVLNKDNETLLHEAIKGNHLKIVNLVLNKGIDINVQNNSGKTALHLAAYNGYLDIVKELIQRGAEIEVKSQQHGETALLSAASGGHVDVIEYLLENNADINSVNNYGNNVLHCAAKAGKGNAVTYLLKCGIDPFIGNYEKENALKLAKTEGKENVVSILKESMSNRK